MPNRHHLDFSAEEPDRIEMMWKKYAPYWHVCVAILTAGAVVVMWYTTVNASVMQTNKNTTDIVAIQEGLSEMQGEVHGIALALGVKKQ